MRWAQEPGSATRQRGLRIALEWQTSSGIYPQARCGLPAEPRWTRPGITELPVPKKSLLSPSCGGNYELI